jgi:hypothetical protein
MAAAHGCGEGVRVGWQAAEYLDEAICVLSCVGTPATALSVCGWGGLGGLVCGHKPPPTLLVAVCVCDDAAQR